MGGHHQIKSEWQVSESSCLVMEILNIKMTWLAQHHYDCYKDLIHPHITSNIERYRKGKLMTEDIKVNTELVI